MGQWLAHSPPPQGEVWVGSGQEGQSGSGGEKTIKQHKTQGARRLNVAVWVARGGGPREMTGLPEGKWGLGFGRKRSADGRFPDEVSGRGCWIPAEGRPSVRSGPGWWGPRLLGKSDQVGTQCTCRSFGATAAREEPVTRLYGQQRVTPAPLPHRVSRKQSTIRRALGGRPAPPTAL